MKQCSKTVIYAAALRDATGVRAQRGAVVVDDGRVIFAGPAEAVDGALLSDAVVVDRQDCLLLPAMVNAHTHLELTSIGPQPYDPAGGFVGWVKMLREKMAPTAEDLESSAANAALSVVKAGVQAVGDITQERDEPRGTLNDANLFGQAYIELFGLGLPFDQSALETIARTDHAVQPHAPYSAGPAVYEAAARSGRPVCTHLAETQEEIDFVSRRQGTHLDFLKSIGKWDEAFAKYYGNNLSPIQWMQPYLERVASDGGWLVAHCNYVSDEDIAILANTNTSVAYCPIASEYFGHNSHRYLDMLKAGINVCLGTDSIVCAMPNDPQPLGLLSAMRRLYERDQTDPDTLLAMATTNGAKALRLDETVATLQPGAPGRFACIPIDRESPTDPLVQALKGQESAEGLSLE